MIPGEYILQKEDIVCNSKRTTIRISIKNTGDRPIQVGSHFHFFEVNGMLEFERARSFGMRLNIPAGTAIRFEPGESKEVFLTTIGGKKKIHGFNNLTEGVVTDPGLKATALQRAKKGGFKGA